MDSRDGYGGYTPELATADAAADLDDAMAATAPAHPPHTAVQDSVCDVHHLVDRFHRIADAKLSHLRIALCLASFSSTASASRLRCIPQRERSWIDAQLTRQCLQQAQVLTSKALADERRIIARPLQVGGLHSAALMMECDAQDQPQLAQLDAAISCFEAALRELLQRIDSQHDQSHC